MNDNISNTKKQRFYAICGIIAPIIFWIMVIVESILRPGYSQYYNFVSDLGVGHLAILQNINFILLLQLFFNYLIIVKLINIFRNKYKFHEKMSCNSYKLLYKDGTNLDFI